MTGHYGRAWYLSENNNQYCWHVTMQDRGDIGSMKPSDLLTSANHSTNILGQHISRIMLTLLSTYICFKYSEAEIFTRTCQFSRVSTHWVENYLFSKHPTRENSDSLPAVSLGVATLNSSEELSITIITITFTSEIFLLFWNNNFEKGRKAAVLFIF